MSSGRARGGNQFASRRVQSVGDQPDDEETPTMAIDTIHLYWRPGCGFCSRLRRRLDEAGIATVDHDIWANPDDAAIVRRHARGNETVPTVVIGDVGLVNPSMNELARHLRQHAPQLLPDDFEDPAPGPIARLFGG
jgi:mycoredoxin